METTVYGASAFNHDPRPCLFIRCADLVRGKCRKKEIDPSRNGLITRQCLEMQCAFIEHRAVKGKRDGRSPYLKFCCIFDVFNPECLYSTCGI